VPVRFFFHAFAVSTALGLVPVAAAEPLRANTPESYQQEVIEASRTEAVVVFLDASWCGPCQAMRPALYEAAEQRGLRLVVVDIDANPMVPMELRVSAIPVVVLFRGGRAIGSLAGLADEDRLAEFLDAG
jgi:thioredoxin-like negative regulator of GroEL